MYVAATSGMHYFIVTVDTEADDAWTRPERIELTNLREIPRFQELCEKYDVIPTYLVTYECATRDEALYILQPFSNSGRCEIGHHLHCWTTPPFQKKGNSGVDVAWLHAYQSELPDSLFREKAEVLSDAIEKGYGNRPTSHRAGRWGIDQRTIDWLIDNGFLVDSSVVPFTSYSGGAGKTRKVPCSYSSPLGPYFYQGKSIHEDDNSSLMEIPVTVDIPTSFPLRVLRTYMQMKLPGKRVVHRLFRRLGGGKPL